MGDLGRVVELQKSGYSESEARLKNFYEVLDRMLYLLRSPTTRVLLDALLGPKRSLLPVVTTSLESFSVALKDVPSNSFPSNDGKDKSPKKSSTYDFSKSTEKTYRVEQMQIPGIMTPLTPSESHDGGSITVEVPRAVVDVIMAKVLIALAD
jgi:hypothetical protein